MAAWLKSRKLLAFTFTSLLVVVGSALAGPLSMSDVTYSGLTNALVLLYAAYSGTNVAAKAANRIGAKDQSETTL